MRWKTEIDSNLLLRGKNDSGLSGSLCKMICHYNFVIDSFWVISSKPRNLLCLIQRGNHKSWELICVIAGAFFCRADEFICNNTLCKLHAWVCDGKDDCGDNSDEDTDMCGGLKLSLTRLSFEDNWCIFYKSLLFYFPAGNISLLFHVIF